MNEFPQVFVVGPTASGKSAIALELAEFFQGEIFNVDSVQCYSRVQIGTAKPGLKDLERVPHHLLNWVKPPHKLTVGNYRREAIQQTEQSRAPVRFWVGGSGFYFQALEKGMFVVPEISTGTQHTLQVDLERDGIGALYAELERVDAETARAVKPQDTYRILRALELYREHGIRLSEKKTEFEGQGAAPDFSPPLLKLGMLVERQELARRVRARVAEMLKLGLIEETEELRKEGLGDWAPLQSVGYNEVQQYLDGKLKYDEMIERIVISTMQLAKRQMTWFRRDSAIVWMATRENSTSLRDRATALLRERLDQFGAQRR